MPDEQMQTIQVAWDCSSVYGVSGSSTFEVPVGTSDEEIEALAHDEMVSHVGFTWGWDRVE